MKIGFIGGGNMATAIISGLKQHNFNMQNISVVEPSADKRSLLHSEFDVQTHETVDAIKDSDALVLAVKPQQLKVVCLALKEILTNNQLVISIAAGIRANNISEWLNNHACIVRVMPNTPAQIQAGVSALYALQNVTNAQREQATLILSAVGETLWLDNEKDMDAVTAISGSGPAYVFYLIEALQEAGIALGLSDENAKLLAQQTFAGASALAAVSGTDIALLREAVTSKGGTTEQGLLVMQSENIKEIMLKTAKAAAQKSVILGDALAE